MRRYRYGGDRDHGPYSADGEARLAAFYADTARDTTPTRSDAWYQRYVPDFAHLTEAQLLEAGQHWQRQLGFHPFEEGHGRQSDERRTVLAKLRAIQHLLSARRQAQGAA